jgi:TolB-like protein
VNLKNPGLVVVSLFLVLLSCAGGPAPGADRLDAVIREASDYLNGRLDRDVKIVFLNFQSEYPALSEYVIEGLIENTVNDGLYTVVDRQNLDLIRQEMDFQFSGEVSDETARAIGKQLGAGTIVSGSITPLAELYRLRVRAIDVETARIQGQKSFDVPPGPRVSALTSPNPALNPAAPYPPDLSAARVPSAARDDSPETPAPAGSLAMIPVLDRRRQFALNDPLKDTRRDEIFEPFSMSETAVPFDLWFEVKEWALDRGYVFTRNGRVNDAGEVYDVDTQSALVWCNALSEYLNLPPCYVDGNGMVLKSARFHGDLTDSIAAGVGFWDNVKKLNNNGYRLPSYWEAELIQNTLHITDMRRVPVEPVLNGYAVANSYGTGWARTGGSVTGFRIVQNRARP